MSQERNELDAQRWLRQAHADSTAAENSIASKNFEWAAFQSQQAAEKAVKALWYHVGADPWGHSIVKLVQDFPCAEQFSDLQSILNDAKKLDKLYIPTRYPNGLPDMIPAEVYTLEEARAAVASARAIIDLVKILIKK